MIILGIKYGHDACVSLLIDGEIIADAAEERFSRVKHDSSFPFNALDYCLQRGGIAMTDIDILAIPSENKNYLKKLSPYLIFNNEAETIIGKETLKKINRKLPVYIRQYQLSEKCRLHFCEHHLAHASGAYYLSPYTDDQKVLVFTSDGLGDNTSNAVWSGHNNRLQVLKRFGPEGSTGWFYSNVTEALGWWHGDGEGKTMGLAAYNTNTETHFFKGYYPEYENGDLIVPHAFGNVSGWDDHGARHFHFDEVPAIKKIVEQFGPEAAAGEAQRIIEEQISNIVFPWVEKTSCRRIACAGGVFLNVKLNQKIGSSQAIADQFIYPNAGDTGLALGAALNAHHSAITEKKPVNFSTCFFGPDFTETEVAGILTERKLKFTKLENPSETAAELLAGGKIVGWFQGRMESGPRALGNRSILMSPLNKENKYILNKFVKFRESFRPFCPSVLDEKKDDYFEDAKPDYFMITAFNFKESKKAVVPAVVHVDGTGRMHSVRRGDNSKFYEVIKHFGDITGEYIILNTSLNIKGEPVVCTPVDAVKCFFSTGIDAMVIENFLLTK